MSHNTIGNNIKTLRKKNRMTQEKMAKKLYLKRQTLSNYEIGKCVPDIYELVKIADLFDISLDELVGHRRK